MSYRPEGSISKLNIYKCGFKVLIIISILFKEYRSTTFLNIMIYDFKKVLVPRFPCLIVSGFMLVFTMLLWITGIIKE